MRSLLVAVLVCIAITLQPSRAQGGGFSPVLLTGKWIASETLPNGAVMSMDLTLTPDMKFSGLAKVQGNDFWSYSGSWELSENQLTWHYENSSRPLSEAMKTDIDDIVSVDGDRLVLNSRLSGKQHVYVRPK
jgi:hypothetical protein